MADSVALITGGAKGIGRAVGLDLARQGWSVAFCFRNSGQAAEETAAAIQDAGGEAMPVQCDVSDVQACSAFAHRVENEWGRIDALVHCAGPYHRVSLLKESAEGWHSMFDNNLHPVFHLTQAVVPGMQQRKSGRIITFSMANADKLSAQTAVTAHYIAKIGVLVLTKAWAKQLAKDGITANVISPGFVNSGSAPAEELESMRKKIPAGYIGELPDAVAAVRYLLSDEARYVNGGNIHLSGGWGI